MTPKTAIFTWFCMGLTLATDLTLAEMALKLCPPPTMSPSPTQGRQGVKIGSKCGHFTWF